MAEPKVFLVLLRQPNSTDPSERRDDPFYEFGSFGCTGCHGRNLLHRRHAKELEGARLAFVQGGQFGSRLVFLTPPITVKVWPDRCEARWTPAELPFRYPRAPIVAYNRGPGHFQLVEQFARNTRRTTVEGGLASRFRSRAHPLSQPMAKEVIDVYRGHRDNAQTSDIARTYLDALPFDPPSPDHKREATYHRHLHKLGANLDADDMVRAEPPPRAQAESPRGSSPRRQLGRRAKRCT